MLGWHQAENAAVAFAALQKRWPSVAFSFLVTIRQGFAAASWAGRFEILQPHPPVVVDSAHNRDSAVKLGLA